MRIGLILEGTTDRPLLHSLLTRIAQERASITWPLSAEDMAEVVPIRKRGQGGVVATLRQVIQALDAADPPLHDFYVVLLDHRTKQEHAAVRKFISGRPKFVFGTAIEEIEAWWLADRRSTLAWLGLDEVAASRAGYDVQTYKAEKDPDPKHTLDKLTRISDSCDRPYGRGHTGLAEDFAEYWKDTAELGVIETQCPKGFRPFCQKSENTMTRVLNEHGKLF